MVFRLLVALAAGAFASSAGTLVTASSSCGLTTPAGTAYSSFDSGSSHGDGPHVFQSKTCSEGDPQAADPYDAGLRATAWGAFYIPDPTDPIELGNNQLVWQSTSYVDTVAGYQSRASSEVEMEAWWTTGGPPRAGLLEITFLVFDGAEFSIAGFGCGSCRQLFFSSEPFELGVPFRIHASASGSVDFDGAAPIRNLFESGGYVVFRAREVSGEIVPFAPTPEPAAIGGFLLGAGALFVLRRRRGLSSASTAAPRRLKLGQRPPCG